MSQHRNGCHNRPDFRPSLIVQDGWFLDGVTRVPKLVSVPFRMNPDCQYRHTTLGQQDTSCDGCKRRNPQEDKK